MADTQLVWSCVFILIIVSMSYSDESCGHVKITSPVSNTVNVSVNDWLNMTFTLNTEKCSSPANVITVEKKEQDRPMIICRIHHNQTSCYTTGHETTYSCRCVSPSGPVQFWEKLVRPGDVEYKWRWKNESGKQGEKNITFHITTGHKKKAQRLQTMKFILGGTGGLLVIVIAVVVISVRCHKSSPSGDNKSSNGSNGSNVLIIAAGAGTGGVVVVGITVAIIIVIRKRKRSTKSVPARSEGRRRNERSRGGNAQNETANGNEGERTSKKSDSSTSSPGQAAGNGSKSGGSTPRSSSSGSDKPSTNPNYTSTALQEVEIHPYMDLHTRDPTYASTTSSKDPHMYMELKTLKALQPGSEKNGNDGYETPQVPGQANKSSDGYETPQPPREGRRRSATYANQGVPADPIQEEVNYYNEA